MLGLDIGGANLKIANGRGYARSMPFALWSSPKQLSDVLLESLAEAPESDAVAVTMTGELCDCFESKADGVRHILASVVSATSGRKVDVYLSDGRFVSVDHAIEQPNIAAASNWHALATFACRYVESGTGLLVDIGSTTADIIPLSPIAPIGTAADDTSRLIAGELVYSGVSRTPVCAIVDSVPYRGQNCPIAAEFFAQTVDAYVFLGSLPEEQEDSDTADGRPRTKPFARARMARSICADPAGFTATDARAVAIAIRDTQIARILGAARSVVARMPERPSTIVLSGAGEFVGRAIHPKFSPLNNVISLEEEFGSAVSQCAPAHALAVLAQERNLPYDRLSSLSSTG